MRKILAGLLMAGTATVAQAQSFNTVGSGNTLVTSTVAAPGTSTSSRAVTGLAAGDNLVGIDYRPAQSRVLYGTSQTGRLYAINPNTGVATQVGTPGFLPAGNVGFDFNPQVDRIRVVTSTGQDVRLNQTVTGSTSTLAATDGTLRYADGTTAIPSVAGAAYTNNVAGTASTTLYVIDTRGGTGNAVLATQGSVGSAPVSPNSGQLYAVGSLGVTTTGAVGFDILTVNNTTNTAYATLTSATGVTSLYTINLTTGAATLVGALAGNTTYNGLALSLAPFASFGTTPNQAAVGGALDAFTGVPSANVNGLFNAIDGLSAAGQADALQQLSPASLTLLPDISLNIVEAQETNILRYLRDLRGNAVDPDGNRVSVDEAGRVGAFFLGGARFGSYDADIDRPQVDNDSYHFMGGLDFRFNERITLGAFGGWGQTDARLSRLSDQSRLRNWFAGAFTTVGVGPFYIDAFGSYTDLDWDITRAINIGALSSDTIASTDGRIWSAGGATGLSFSLGNFEVEPYAGIRYADVKIDGFTETGSIGSLVVPDIEDESLRLNLGGRIGTKFDVMGANARIQFRGAWLREFLMNDSRTMTVNFTEPGIGSAFTFTTNPLSAEYYNVGAALNIAGSGPLSMVADYDVQFDDERQFHALTVGARLAF
ncbi:uncharacterized protein with beta-barrel porin domain [Sphingomonas jejuensis]|uniref:Uncharacterized protein with beta-barrel porin domain n=1 Tax=Sphingomonas jejuensis TaxID=904715 RepID=A0ABX0XJ86_9SPHN|nr:DUF4394 domain-containing protein [Sphingomonas jejuensis]NJC32795.1 uncharacterized protein with beta-barrel porin domain [Sphingomonas jejuensis]